MTETTPRTATPLTELLAEAPKNWHRWGAEDELGALNFLTPQEVLRGAAEIRDGHVFTLQRPLGHPQGDPLYPGRKPATRKTTLSEANWDEGRRAPDFPGGVHCADDVIEMNLQGSTQYDALGHAWYDGELWNGFSADTTRGGLSRASVLPMAEHGAVGRAVLLDFARFLGVESVDHGHSFDLEDVLACAEAQGTEVRPHDILVFRTNYLQRFYDEGAEFWTRYDEPGLRYSPALVDWFHRMEIPNLVSDTIGNEPTIHPEHGTALVLHNALMRNLGVAFTEIALLEDLAAHLAETGRSSFFYVAAPLKIHEASGAPVNPIAIT